MQTHFHGKKTRIEEKTKPELQAFASNPAFNFIRDDLARVCEFYTHPETGNIRYEKMQAVLCVLLTDNLDKAAQKLSQDRIMPVSQTRPYIMTTMRETSEFWQAHAEFFYKRGMIFAKGKLFSAVANTGLGYKDSFNQSRRHIDEKFTPILTKLIDSTFYPKEPDSVPTDKQMRGYIAAQLMRPGKEKEARFNILSHGLRKGLHEELMAKSAQITIALAEQANIVLPNGLVKGAAPAKPAAPSGPAPETKPVNAKKDKILPFLSVNIPALAEPDEESLRFKRNLQLLAMQGMDMAKAVARYNYLYGDEHAMDRTLDDAAKKFGCTEKDIEASCRTVGAALERLEAADKGLKAKP